MCLVHRDHRVYCGGSDYTGRGDLGFSNFFSVSGGPQAHDAIGRVREVHVGDLFDCAIRRDERVVCWGRVPELADSERNETEHHGFVVAQPFAKLGRVESLAVTYSSACALTKGDGRVFCWGSNLWGKLGQGHGEPIDEVVEVPDLAYVKSLSANGHTCALHHDGGVSCWGDDFENRPPTRIEGLNDAVQVAVGGDFACARHADGRVSCWGRDSHGQLGIPNRYEVVELDWRALLEEPEEKTEP